VILLGFVFKETTLHSTQKSIQKYRITDMKQHLVNMQNISNSRSMQMQPIGDIVCNPSSLRISPTRATQPPAKDIPILVILKTFLLSEYVGECNCQMSRLNHVMRGLEV
jgi:hypothetical protein